LLTLSKDDIHCRRFGSQHEEGLDAREVAMADDENIPKVDRRGTTILVPIGLAVVCAVLVVLMIWPKGNETPQQGPSGGGTARPGAVK